MKVYDLRILLEQDEEASFRNKDTAL